MLGFTGLEWKEQQYKATSGAHLSEGENQIKSCAHGYLPRVIRHNSKEER